MSDIQEAVLPIQHPRIAVKIHAPMEAYRRRTGVRMTYAALAGEAGVSKATIQSLAARPTNNTRLSTVARVCAVLGFGPGDLLELVDSQRSS